MSVQISKTEPQYATHAAENDELLPDAYHGGIGGGLFGHRQRDYRDHA